MRLRSLASLRPWLYPYNIEIIYIPISIIYYLVSYYGTVFLCINLLLTFTVIQPAAAKVINKQINQNPDLLLILCVVFEYSGKCVWILRIVLVFSEVFFALRIVVIYGCVSAFCEASWYSGESFEFWEVFWILSLRPRNEKIKRESR